MGSVESVKRWSKDAEDVADTAGVWGPGRPVLKASPPATTRVTEVWLRRFPDPLLAHLQVTTGVTTSRD